MTDPRTTALEEGTAGGEYRLVNLTLERVACALERREGNALYRRAWAIAAEVVRSFKKSTGDEK